MSEPTVRTELDQIRQWLTERVGYYLERSPEQIDQSAPLVEMGLDSVYALTLCGDVEDRYGLLVEATVAWDHPTIDALTTHLADELERA
ncbi:acyl carrier protein [Streptomyces antarcticus]|uniref:acyl carrier protein n=1 Tax=Streptomyces antarcticus TaxID=2996458 RepID=UPI00227180C7|nr:MULTISPECIES: acyl carrier protein [unclassified Streptomyces]MCY0947064.1 acyl carrier protein [Streptomyces sp. H34-AA3]MCZ4084771.1 acyl carrier protein [Streptomyces sp. H34-S5]